LETREDGKLIEIDFVRGVRRVPETRLDTVEMVEGWHKIFGVPVREEPGFPPLDRRELRVNLIDEEFKELKKAIDEGDLVGVLDALTDLKYVIDGALCEFGLQGIAREAFEEVHRSNLSKLDADGHPIKREDGKILKGPNYTPPDLETILGRAILGSK
jgi:predicted HAD superfamily Cof-like phosphohydrolase